MTIQDYARMVAYTRKLQNFYFESRSREDLQNARSWERKLDQATDEILNPKNPGLFDEPIKEGP